MASDRPIRPLLLTLAQAAEMLALSPARLRELVMVGEVPSVVIGGRTRRFSVRQLEAWVEFLEERAS